MLGGSRLTDACCSEKTHGSRMASGVSEATLPKTSSRLVKLIYLKAILVDLFQFLLCFVRICSGNRWQSP